MKIKYVLVLAVVSMAVGAAVTRTYLPREVVKTETVEVTKEKIITVTHTEKKPDGTEVTDSTKTETRNTTESSNSTVTKAPELAQWMVSGGYGVVEQTYSAGVQRRIAGPIWVGAEANTNKEVYIKLAVEF